MNILDEYIDQEKCSPFRQKFNEIAERKTKNKEKPAMRRQNTETNDENSVSYISHTVLQLMSKISNGTRKF